MTKTTATTVMTEDEADAYVRSWMSAWNTHDAEAIGAHYHPDVEYHSPFVAALGGETSSLVGRPALDAYIRAGLDRYPDLELGPTLWVAPGVGSVAMVYRSLNDLLAVETLVFGDEGLVVKALCHYRAGP